MSLEDLRKKIDETDAAIVRLIAERIRSAEKIGREKQKQGKQVEDLSREAEVLTHIRRVAEQENVTKSVEGLRVAFQGEIGAYS